MSAAEQFWIVVFVAVVIGVITGHLIERKRAQTTAELDRRRREHKAEVERAARKAL